MRNRIFLFSLFSLVLSSHSAAVLAAEPNETFETATVLAPNVRSVVDAFTDPGEPDTLLGIRGTFGDIVFVDDDSSPAGNGTASGVGGVPTNSGSIDFAITGFGDDGFSGGHGESGAYQVFIDIYDFFDDPIEQRSEIRTLGPGVVHEFSFNDFEWIGGSYDVYIDNVISGDVDFFTFTGLTPGATFTAQTFDPTSAEVDTLLGWFDSSGGLLETNDDIDEGNLLSIITGTTPANGQLTFAVTGFGDENFEGVHGQGAAYELRLTVDSALTADFDDDNDVDGADFLAWRRAFSENANANADNDSDSDGADFLAWQREFGNPASVGQAAAVPEPSAAILLALAILCNGPAFSRHRARVC